MMQVIGISCTKDAIYTSDGKVFSEGKPLTNLLDCYSFQQLVSLDLDADLARIVRQFGITKQEAITLLDKEKLYISGTDIKLTYFRGRYVAIDRGRGSAQETVEIYNTQSFVDAVKHKNENAASHHLMRAIQAKDIGIMVLKAYRNLRLPHHKLTTPIATFLKAMPLDIPIDIDTPGMAQDLAYQAVRHNWSEIYKIGYFEHTWDMDITLAYSSELADLVDTRRGKWVESASIPDGAVYGFASGMLHIDSKADFHPFLVNEQCQDEDGNDASITYAPRSSYPTTLPLNEIFFLRRYNLGRLDIDQGIWFVPPIRMQHYHPLKGVIHWLQAKRNESTGLQREVVKRIQNSIWGRTGQIKYDRRTGQARPGELANFVYHSVVESNIRLKLAAMILDNKLQDHVLRIAVDGCIVSKYPKKLDAGNNMGQWKIKPGKALIATGGAAVHESRPYSEKDYALNFNPFYQYFLDNPGATSYPMYSIGVVTLASAIKYDRLHMLGEYEDRSRQIPLGKLRTKRLWPYLPQNGQELLSRVYDSYAAPYNTKFEIMKGEENVKS